MLNADECIRLYNENGKHIFSFVYCSDSTHSKIAYDLITPDGSVVYCGVPSDLVSLFAEHLGATKF